MKLFRKTLSILLVFAILFTSLFPTRVKAMDISQGASKGDLRLGSYTESNKNSVEIVKTDANGVSVKKVVSKKSTGTYNVEFFIKGPKTQVTQPVTLPVYVVFVIDRSYSMKNDNRWTNAESAAVSISKEFSKLGVNMAAVGYSGGRSRSESKGGDQIQYNDTVDIRDYFSTSPITDFGNYDKDYTYGGGTNMYAGLERAYELLKNKSGVKHIVLLTDGVPTFYYDSNGYTKGPGNSNTDEKISAVPAVIEKTIAKANSIKSKGITIHTIGYHLDKLTYKYGSLKENELAKQTLTGISTSTSTYHLVDSSNKNTSVSIELGNIKDDIMNLNVAENPTVIDGIGNKFKLTTTSNYGGSKTLSLNNYSVENTWKSLGSFDINIDTTSPTGWYATNANFTLKYTHVTKGEQTFTYTDNPEVYWTQPVSWVINHVEKDNISNVLKTENGSAELKDIISVNKKDFEGYTYDSQDKQSIVIDTENNIAYVYYTKNNYDYTIYHVEKDNPSNVLDIEGDKADYKDVISVNKKDFEGYTYVDQDKQSIVIDTKNNIAYVYYTKNNYDYTIYHVEKDNPSNVLDIEGNKADYKDVISVNKKDFEGYTYDSQDKQSIVIDTEDNIAYVYYNKNVYSYTVEYYKENLDGEFELVEDDTVVYENSKYGSETSFNVNEYVGYTYVPSLTENADVLQPANNDLVIRLYYTLNDGEATVHYVIKVGDNYIPFEEYALDENGEIISDFIGVDLNSVYITGKIGSPFETEYRVLDGYDFVGLYEGDILLDNTIPKLDGKLVISTLDVESKVYTYVYELPAGTGDEFPPHTDVVDSIFINNNNVAIIEDKKRKF